MAAKRLDGSIISAQVTLPEPYFSNASANPATEPGTPLALQPTVDEPAPLVGLPSFPKYISRDEAEGAFSR